MRLTDAAAAEIPFQLSNIKTHPDGTLASASVSFYGALEPNRAYAYQLRAEKPTTQLPMVKAQKSDAGLVLDDGITAVWLPQPVTLQEGKMFLFSDEAPAQGDGDKTVAPGPIQGIRLADGSWTGGSCFWAKNRSMRRR